MRELVKRYRAISKRTVSLSEITWEELWHKDLAQVRSELRLAAA